MTVHAKLNRARLMFHALPLKKSGHNKFANFRYFELSDFLVPALEICSEVGISCTISFASDNATMRIVDIDDGSAIIINTPVADAGTKGQIPIQSLGSQHTYLRRYLWMLAFEIVESDAVDSVSGNVEPATISENQFTAISDLIAEVGADTAAMAKYFKVNSISELPASEFKNAVEMLNKKKK